MVVRLTSAEAINPGQSPQDVAEQMSQQIRSGPHPELVAFVPRFGQTRRRATFRLCYSH